jgi:hypothetical protein
VGGRASSEVDVLCGCVCRVAEVGGRVTDDLKVAGANVMTPVVTNTHAQVKRISSDNTREVNASDVKIISSELQTCTLPRWHIVSLCRDLANCFGVSLTSLASWSWAALPFSPLQHRSNAAPEVYGRMISWFREFLKTQREHGSNRVSSAVVGSAKQHHAESSVSARIAILVIQVDPASPIANVHLSSANGLA